MILTQSSKSNAGVNQSHKKSQLDVPTTEVTASVTVLFTSPKSIKLALLNSLISILVSKTIGLFKMLTKPITKLAVQSFSRTLMLFQVRTSNASAMRTNLISARMVSNM